MVSLKMEMSFGMDPLLEWKFEDAQNSHRVTTKGVPPWLIRGHRFPNNCGGVQLLSGKIRFQFYCWGGDPPKKQDKGFLRNW